MVSKSSFPGIWGSFLLEKIDISKIDFDLMQKIQVSNDSCEFDFILHYVQASMKLIGRQSRTNQF